MFRGSFRAGGAGADVISITSADSPFSVPLTSTILLVDSTSGVVNVSLPLASLTEGVLYYVKNTGGGNVNRVRILVSSGLIDNASFVDLDQDFSAVTLVSDGTNYYIIS